MNIRRADLADEAGIKLIRRRAILEIAGRLIGKEESEKWVESAPSDRFIRAIVESRVSVAEDEQKLLGWVEVRENWIKALYVLPESTGKGVGSLLLQCAEAEIAANGQKVVRLDASQNAKEFYKSRGYIPMGRVAEDGSIPMLKTVGLK